MRNGHHNNNKPNNQSRNRNNNRSNNRGSGKPSNGLNRSYESNGPGVKIRGSSSQVAEKYLTLARDAQSSGDSIAYEGFMQHAEHYIRLIAASHEAMRAANPNWRPEPLSFMSNQDDEDEDNEGDVEGQVPPQRQVYDENSDQPDVQEQQPRRQDRFEHPERGERPERQERPDRPQRQDRGERQERQPRAEGEERQPRPRFNRFDRQNRRPQEGEVSAPVGEDGGLTPAPVENLGLPAFLTAPVPKITEPKAETAETGEETPHIQRRRRPRFEARVTEPAPISVIGE